MVQIEECQTKYMILIVDPGFMQIKKISGVNDLMKEITRLDMDGHSYDVMRVIGHDNKWRGEIQDND